MNRLKMMSQGRDLCSSDPQTATEYAISSSGVIFLFRQENLQAFLGGRLPNKPRAMQFA
jgi:hypothetical protein